MKVIGIEFCVHLASCFLRAILGAILKKSNLRQTSKFLILHILYLGCPDPVLFVLFLEYLEQTLVTSTVLSITEKGFSQIIWQTVFQRPTMFAPYAVL